MSTTAAKLSLVHIDPDPTAVDVEVSDAALRIVAPRQNREAIGRGHGMHWPDPDEDISVRALMGRPT
jgi:hypothetical protein